MLFYRSTSWLLMGLSLGVSRAFVLGTWSHVVGVVSVAFGLYLIIKKRLDTLPALLSLIVPELFVHGIHTEEGAGPAQLGFWAVLIVSSATLVGMSDYLKRVGPKGTMLVFVGMMFLAGVATLKGLMAGHPRWPEAAQAVVVLGGFFYGWTLTADWGLEPWNAFWVNRFRKPALLFLGIAAIAVFPGHARFLVIGLAAAYLGTAIVTPLRSILVQSLVVLVLVAQLSSGIHIGIASAAFLLSILWTRLGRRWARAATVGLVLVLSLVVAFGATQSGRGSPINHPSFELPNGVDPTTKLSEDRGPLWRAAWAELRTNGWADIPASGSGFQYRHFTRGTVEWYSGAHNSVLEIGLQIGLLGSLAFAFFILWSVLGIFKQRPMQSSIGAPMRQFTVVVGAAAVSTLLVGATFGHFPLQLAGWPIWVLLGVCSGSDHESVEVASMDANAAYHDDCAAFVSLQPGDSVSRVSHPR